MKIQVSKSDLIALLAKTQNIVEKRNTMPMLINVLIDAQNDKLKIFATDLEVSLTDEISCEVKEPGKVAIDAKNLFNLVKELNEGPIQILKKQNNWVEIRQNKSTFNIVGLSSDEYPIFPIYEGNEFLELPSKVLLEMIEKTIYSVSNDDTKYHLNGVFFERLTNESSGQYRMVATDGHRLSLVDRSTGINSGTTRPGVIIPRKGLHEVRKILETNKESQIKIAVEGAQLIVKLGPTLLMVRLIEGRYPNYQALIPQSLKRHAEMSKAELVASLRRVSLLSNQKSKGVTFTFSDGNLQITSNNPDLGDAKEEIEISYKGEEIKIGFNARYLLDALASIQEDSIDLDLNDQLSPVVLRPHGDKNYTCIIMPMRI